MKYTTCQLVQGNIIRGYVHLIGQSNGSIWPLCDQPQVRLCDNAPWHIYLTDRPSNCPRCAKVTTRTPLAVDGHYINLFTGIST